MALLLTDAEQTTLDKYYVLETNSSDECEEEDTKLAEEHPVPKAEPTRSNPGPSRENQPSPYTERQLIYGASFQYHSASDSDEEPYLKNPASKRRLVFPSDD